MGNVTIGGLVTGINTDSIIQGLLKVQQQQIDQYTSRQTTLQTKQAAYQSVDAQLTSFRSAAASLASSVNNPFDARTVSVSNSSALLASATSKAALGAYSITVNSLASAQQVASQSFNNADAAITQGTFSIRIGDQQTAAITIDSTNNTLSGLSDAINFANIGVAASVVQDGANSYRLLLTSSKTGTANAIHITNDLADSGNGAVKPAIDFDHPVQAAADAQVTLGSGAGALTVTSSTNTVSNLISGVTLNLLSADPTKPISVSIAADASKATQAVSDFVTAYNGVLDFIDKLTAYDPSTNTGQALQGDSAILGIRNQLQSIIQSIIPGGSPQANRLSALGITTSDNGRLTLDQNKLQNLISGSSGVSTSDLKHLFALDGVSSNGSVTYLLGSANTKESTTPYQVFVTQAAQRATISAGAALANTTTIDDSNNTLTLTLDGRQIAVTLANGDYSQNDLAAELEDVINNNSNIAGRSVSIGVGTDGKLSITSDSYGSSSQVTLTSGSAISTLGFAGNETNKGMDVAGYFLVNGKRETATGSGRVLSGAAGNANTDGLQVKVTLTPGQITSDAAGTISVTRGVLARMDSLLGNLLQTQVGRFAQIDSQYTAQIASIQKSIDRQQSIFDKQQADLQQRFADMESAIQKLQSTGSALGAQLSGISSLSSSSSSSSG